MIHNAIWYWEYIVLVMEDDKEVERCGVVTGEDCVEAVKSLHEFYGDEIENIFILKPISDGVFEFNMANDNEDCDFSFHCKPRVAEPHWGGLA